MKSSEAVWRSVLIVDDDRDTREMYSESLRAMGFHTTMASSAEEALRIASHTPPAVLVTDLRFKGTMDGVELARRLREDERTKHVRIIMLTGATFGDERERAEACGCDRLLLKPCLPEQLASEIRRLAVSSFSPGAHGGNLRAADAVVDAERSGRRRPDRRKI
jgi:two-component system phosphate regulon response regulator PhoB